MYKHLFGPVPSRRLGRSLGIDLVPLKVCSFNCLFCQAGVTSTGTLERREYVSCNEVIAELDSWVRSGGTADYITFSGSGEPTLNVCIEKVIQAIRARTDSKIALLTNSTLLHIPEVRNAIADVDLIKGSLSAWDDDSLAKINRPCGDVTIDKIIEGLMAVHRECSGKLWLEVFLLAGINDNDAAVKKIAVIAESIKPDKIQLNTVARPPAESAAKPVSAERLSEYAGFFNPPAEVIPQVHLERYDDEVRDRPVLDS